MDHAVLISVAEQMMASAESSENHHPLARHARRVGQTLGQPKEVIVEGHGWPVMRTGTGRLRTVRFEMGGKGYQAIEQNAQKPSRWGTLAREGHKVVQFRDIGSGKYGAVVVDGKVTEYGRR